MIKKVTKTSQNISTIASDDDHPSAKDFQIFAVVVIFIVVVVILKGAFVGRESMGKEVEEIPNCL